MRSPGCHLERFPRKLDVSPFQLDGSTVRLRILHETHLDSSNSGTKRIVLAAESISSGESAEVAGRQKQVLLDQVRSTLLGTINLAVRALVARRLQHGQLMHVSNTITPSRRPLELTISADTKTLRRSVDNLRIVGEDGVVGTRRDAEITIDAVVQFEGTVDTSRLLSVRFSAVTAIVGERGYDFSSVESSGDAGCEQNEAITVVTAFFGN
jgi:hypothetical protein